MRKRGYARVSNKKAQITVFIIIAILLVALVVLFFVFRGKVTVPIIKPGNVAQNPQGYLDSCLKPKIKQGADIIIKHGGYISNKLNITLDNEQITYLCYTDGYYTPCINQEPMLIDRVKKELHQYIENDVEKCFSDMKKELEAGGYQVNMKEGSFDVILAPRRVMVQMNRELTISKSNSVQNFKTFRTILPHSLYDLAIVAQEISSQEAKYCNFEQVGFMLLYPDFKIDKFRLGGTNSATVYTIIDKRTKEVFKFAVRTCVMPPGF